ncbi:IS5 family transposase [Candidatus Tisiphia endosymbiont of Hybos culiciformis]|uniref:IS5 family transposase n=1 Tax=Candidatus Tisiphia endosymbiont of Hybos culiciformis TaxID=3139331 RepID=UPI003CCB43AD
MSKYDQSKRLEEEEFRRLTGVKKATFNLMVNILQESEKVQKIKSGKPHKLCVEDRLLLTLEYLREYRTYFHIATSYGVHETTALRIIRWVENVLVKSKDFALPGRKALSKSDIEYEVILVDVAESPCERPKKRVRKKKRVKNRKNKQRYYYSGKKKRHTLKTQIVVDKKSKKIICTNFANGKKHDFKLFKESKILIHPEVSLLGDSGYQGMKKLHSNSFLPKKKSKKKPLTNEDKKNNQNIASQRVTCEHIIGRIKRFKIIADRYRNRRKRFALRVNLIAGICNFET